MEPIIFNYYNSPIGEIELAANSEALLWLKFVETKKAKRPKQKITETLLFKKAKVQLDSYFNSALDVFDLPIEIQGTDFQKTVWQKLLSIPFGKTTSYLVLAKQIGDAKAVRAVAASNAKNRFCIIIPCHRVIGTNGSLTGYSGDLWRKKWLLDHESKNKDQQGDLFL